MLFTYLIRNDKISLGFVKNGTPAFISEIATDPHRTKDEYAILLGQILAFHNITPSAFSGAICASVVPSMTGTLKDAVALLTGLRTHVIGSGIRTGLTIATDDPAELGGDLVACAVGALKQYQPPMILIHFGTAITFSVIDEGGRYIGCAISPGMTLSRGALTDAAGLLPQISCQIPKGVIGSNTRDSMISGSILGGASLVDGMLTRIENALGRSAKVIFSGEDGRIILPYCTHKLEEDDRLAFIGLASIYEKNRRCQ